jgi:hypothetical protein
LKLSGGFTLTSFLQYYAIWNVFVLVEYVEVTIMNSYRVNTLFYVIYIFPDESILTGELEDE